MALSAFWDKIVFNVMMNGSNTIKKFGKMVLDISSNVKEEVIQKYSLICQFQYLIAFSQWRLIYHPEKVEKLSKYSLRKDFFKEVEEYLQGLFRDTSTATNYFKLNLTFLTE